MNKRIKKKWVAALESGKYKQTRGKLKGLKGYCCLGVLCDIYCKEKDADFGVATIGNGCLPTAVRVWADLKDNNPQVKTPTGKESSLAVMNDSGKHNFKKIAQVIKEQL